ncbi:MAG: hypothetical protein A2Z99_19495 [Treponema sp. GWB1_62_6]|nr:MAG: hypothetical protein A2001_11955 [Treponema sp. GWC1_61_84]OHE72232.1 MAG: hypothetical protein A2Z99_19495 [Treponema sp. GWB1_62_6]OHE72410.1 MAG: hypothetical protein A2413_03700 [Treponema sp. RIFOXYC1_FULL_61_9]HCM28595.1 hypothetical protein [Treponema sp.]
MKRISFLFICLLAVSAAFAEVGDIRRYAIVAGANIGGKTTQELKYAAADAKRMRDVLVRIGGTREENALLLVNPEREALANGFAFMAAKIRKARTPESQAQFVFYYSGHSDERGLLLFGEYYDYGELKAALASLGAEVRIVILDSCSSGAFTREKGGSFVAPFLMDESVSVEGHAYLTSSTAEEASQESDRIGSSFFTHSLINGLRGAADENDDGTVNLNEAYQYAYDRTLAETERARAGAQHPAFDIKLNGTGSLVVTDLRAGEATLKLPKGLMGRLSLRDVSDNLVLEIRKTDEKEMTIGVEQGYYKVLLEEGGSLYETVLIVDESKQYEVRRDAFRGIKAATAALRGTGGSPVAFLPFGFSVKAEEGGSSLYLNLLGGKISSVEGLQASLLYSQTVMDSSGFQGSLFANIAGADFYGFQGSLGVNFARGDLFGLQTALLFNEAGGNLKGVQLSAFNHASADVKIGQIGIANVVAGEGSYFQIGAINKSSKAIGGLQFGLANLGKKVTGLQAGLFNYSEEQTGVQLGLVNVSRKLDGIPIGLIDIQFNGENHVDAILQTSATEFDELNDSLFASTYLRLGSRYFYKYVQAGWTAVSESGDDGYPDFLAGAGLGFRIPAVFEGFAFHIDGGVAYRSNSGRVELVEDEKYYEKIVPQGRVFASCKLFRNSGLLAGVELPVFTKNFHDMTGIGEKFTVLTGAGILVVDPRFFIGFQL